MEVRIVEIKAKCSDTTRIRQVLKERSARFVGTDEQVDTYFTVPEGRLKLRRGSIENTLIFYHRANQQSPKLSEVKLYKPDNEDDLHRLLQSALPILVEVKKSREIYFIGNIKIHIDTVQELGNFAEIEAIDETGLIPESELRRQCEELMAAFGIENHDLLTHSYSDMILNT